MEKSLLPSKEAEKHPVPENLFKNRLSWALYDVARWRATYFGISVLGLSSYGVYCCTYRVVEGVDFTINCSLFLFEIIAISLAFCYSFKKKRALRKERLSLARELIAQKPGMTTGQWDLVAINMNILLHQKGLWHSAHCFYNGADCHEHFRSQMYIPFMKKKDSEEHDVLVCSAIQVYEKELEAYWDTDCILKTCDDEKLELKLPKEIYKSKFTYFTKPLLSWRILIILAVYFAFGGWPVCVVFFPFYYGARYLEGKSKLRMLSLKHRMTFLKVVSDQEPQDDTQQWERVAKIMNKYLSDKNAEFVKNRCLLDKRVAHDIEFFFNEKDCHWMFDKLTASILSSKNTKFPELIPFARESKMACGCGAEDQV
ncbi:LANO_0F02850g1_1 [Lachancea nothofagi CBS 11611]|uniref:LANO_0F02850g1_1 n=1 Tax=Lachancea nothofagi CBS 11611 TaxID=1266666 RepID=A0A1G4K6U8_9SACH|nr:LANO_0F02850g1_1 [Lachancea nothofagi CBS 11611]